MNRFPPPDFAFNGSPSESSRRMPANFRMLWARDTIPNSTWTFSRPRRENRRNDRLPLCDRTHFPPRLCAGRRLLHSRHIQGLFLPLTSIPHRPYSPGPAGFLWLLCTDPSVGNRSSLRTRKPCSFGQGLKHSFCFCRTEMSPSARLGR